MKRTDMKIDDPNRPTCPDCDIPMGRNGVAESGNTRYICRGCKRRTTGSSESSLAKEALIKSEASESYASQLRRAVANGANRFVITSAANNARLNYQAWNSLKRLCKDRNAHLIVIPIHYKNVSLYTGNETYKKWWAKGVEPYMIDESVRIGPKTYVRGDIKIQATAANPLSGMAPVAGDTWVIFGHSQLAMEPIPTPSDSQPGRMYTTGAMTTKSYSSTKVGAKAAFHHVTGALLVEVDGPTPFIRQLNADSHGAIYDVTDCYSGDVKYTQQRALSLTTGDEHVKWILPRVVKATYQDSDCIVNITKPQYIVRHDVLDAYAGSHHHIGRFTTQYKKWFHGNDDYRMELDEVVNFINDTTPVDFECRNLLVTDANHHSHVDWWLEKADDRIDHINADLICELRNAQREAIREGKDYAAFRLYLEPRLQVPCEFTDPSKPYMLQGVDFSQHGHKGANGSRGSAQGFANTTHKATIGHTHSARIVKSIYQVGKSCETLEYESGLSSHTTTHCLQYMNGKRTLIDIIGQNWRATNEPSLGGLSQENL